MKKLITVAIALYNNSKYVERCIASVLDQTYKYIEIIIVDDGSTDDSLQRIDKYKIDKRINIINKKNEGLSSSRQLALEHANGEYICFIDADDYLKNDYIEKLYKRIEDECADICVCGTYFINESGHELQKLSKSYSYTEVVETKMITDDDLYKNYCYYLNLYFMSDSWDKMYKISFFKKTKVRFELPKGNNGTDLAFNHKILLYNPKVTTIKEKEYYHVIYSQSAVHRKHKDLCSSMTIIMQQIIDECVKKNCFFMMKEQLSHLYMEFCRMILQDVYNEQGNISEKKRIFKEICKKTFSFMTQNNLIGVKSNVGTKSMRLFKIFLKSKNQFLLLFYFGFRKRVLNILQKSH